MSAELDIDSDDEMEILEIEQLNAVLESDKPTLSETVSQCSTITGTSFTLDSSIRPEYENISKAIALNKVADEKLLKLEKILIDRLYKCRKKLTEIQNEAVRPVLEESFNYIVCGKPYFKDRNNFPAPDNQDAIIMAKSDMCDFSRVTSLPGWTVKEKTDFFSTLLKMSQKIKSDKIRSEIAHCERQLSKVKSNGTKSKDLKKILTSLENELKSIKTKNLRDIALPLTEDYDWDAIAAAPNSKHKAEEYRSLWKLFLHPSINKTTWTKSEHYALQKIAYKNNLQDWENIALQLQTDRSGYQCFVYFRTNMNNLIAGQKWTQEEVEYLKRLIEYHKEDNYIPWGKVAASMENKTKIQVYNKYLRIVEQRKGRFLKEEDAIILTCVDKFGCDYKKISEYLPGRSFTQVRLRHKILTKRISTVWTVDEDKRLITLMAKQDADINFAALTRYFKGKDRSNLRARYLTLLKFMKKFPNADIAKCPRRGARRLGHGQANSNLNNAVEKLTEKMQSQVADIKRKKITCTSREDVIEDAIVAALVTQTTNFFGSRAEIENQDKNYSDESGDKPTNVNINYLRNVLLLLRAQLSKENFENSYYVDEYPGLIEKASQMKQKSYSKKKPVVLNTDGPDIWGNKTLGHVVYVFPPNFSTIIGCKKFMEYVNIEEKKIEPHKFLENNFRTICKRNPNFKSAYDKFMDRFRTLFLWIMILSNEVPESITTAQTQIITQPSPHNFQKA